MPQNRHQDTKPLSDTFFRGGGSVLKPNHITRYIYPSLCGHPATSLRLQNPVDSKKRSRPQGAFSWGVDGHAFITITRSYRDEPTKSAFEHASTRDSEQDGKSANPLGRAMARVTKYAGNTLLESGKFALGKGEPLVYVVKRTTAIVLTDGEVGKEEEMYVIECGRWRGMMPMTEPGHDSWWMRLHNLYQSSFDRAFFSASDNMDVLDIPAPIVQWYPRPDVESHVKIHRSMPSPPPKFIDDACMICSRIWFSESEYACELKCQHFLCLPCLTTQIDEKGGRGNLEPHEPDPSTRFFRCPRCKAITALPTDRTDITLPDELQYWRWKICMRRLEKEVDSYWVVHLTTLPNDRWFDTVPEHWNHNQLKDKIKVYVRYVDVVRFMEVPKAIWRMLPYGFSLDNPVESREGVVLEDCLKRELKRLSMDRRRVFNTEELIAHMKAVGAKAFKPVVVGNKEARLGNPEYPPGYLRYREFLCEWTARGCFLSPSGRVELVVFMDRMKREKGKAWWGKERELMFDP